ncbi:MAG: DedA family protein, partial [Spirochaetes bacterium]|nr:DedA family protein [Spirochaetota bacterium]
YISSLLTNLAAYMPFISFSLLFIAGFNLPISEDIVILLSGALGATYVPHLLPYIYIGCYAGAFSSDLIAYSLGRIAIRGLTNHRFLQNIVSLDKIQFMENYFQRYGGKTLLFGRFIPFGMRNIIFMTAGFSKMNIFKFIFIDLIPLSITSSLLFYVGVKAGDNYRSILPHLNKFKEVIGIAAILIICTLFLLHRMKAKKNM